MDWDGRILKFGRVWEPAQHWIVAGRFKIFHRAPKDWIEEARSVPHVQIERHQLATKMELRVVVQGIAAVIFQSLLERPGNDVAQSIKVEMQIERDGIVQADALVINRSIMHQAKTERDDLALLAPDKKACP